MSIYRDHILDHYKNPRNKGKFEGFTHYSGKVNNPLCGDEVEVWVTNNKKQITKNPTHHLSLTSPSPSPCTGEGTDDGDGVSPFGEGGGGVLTAIGFDGHGCAICIASASLVTEWVKGKTMGEIEHMTPEIIIELLGISLTPVRLKCALLIRDAIVQALRHGESEGDGI